jgi:hypothetical protein
VANNVVPFGKYKDQPVEAMAADRDYIDWLLAQSWFKDKYQNIYTLVINNFTEPSETPEHNLLQALFLDDAFVKRVVAVHHSGTIYSKVWESEGYLTELRVSFEMSGADVYIDLCGVKFAVEIKPVIGDDYPAVLRQIRNTSCPGYPILFLERYIGAGATTGQFIEVFNRSGVKVVFREDAERQSEIDWSVVIDVLRQVDVAERAFRERWCTASVWGPDRLRIYHKEFQGRLDEQKDLLRQAIKEADDKEIRIHGAAMVRGWQAANRVLEDAEIEKAKKAFPGAIVTSVREKSSD